MQAFTTYYWDVLKKHYVDFIGRANRRQYWMFVLFNVLVFVVLEILLSFLGDTGKLLYFALSLAVLLPSLAIAVRRLHDTDRSGWWLLLNLIPFVGSLVLLVFFVLPSTPGSNRFGN